jgi:hypothetical protein
VFPAGIGEGQPPFASRSREYNQPRLKAAIYASAKKGKKVSFYQKETMRQFIYHQSNSDFMRSI